MAETVTDEKLIDVLKMISKERARQAKARKAKKKPPENGSPT